MQQMSALIENLFIFLVIIIIGYAIGATKKVNPTLKADLSFLLLKVTLPFMVIDAVVQPYNGALIKQGLWTFVFSSIGFLVCWLVSYIFMKNSESGEKKTRCLADGRYFFKYRLYGLSSHRCYVWSERAVPGDLCEYCL